MKQFFKMTLATVCGIAIFLVVTGFFLTISLLGMVASDSASTKVKNSTEPSVNGQKKAPLSMRSWT